MSAQPPSRLVLLACFPDEAGGGRNSPRAPSTGPVAASVLILGAGPVAGRATPACSVLSEVVSTGSGSGHPGAQCQVRVFRKAEAGVPGPARPTAFTAEGKGAAPSGLTPGVKPRHERRLGECEGSAPGPTPGPAAASWGLRGEGGADGLHLQLPHILTESRLQTCLLPDVCAAPTPSSAVPWGRARVACVTPPGTVPSERGEVVPCLPASAHAARTCPVRGLHPCAGAVLSAGRLCCVSPQAQCLCPVS